MESSPRARRPPHDSTVDNKWQYLNASAISKALHLDEAAPKSVAVGCSLLLPITPPHPVEASSITPLYVYIYIYILWKPRPAGPGKSQRCPSVGDTGEYTPAAAAACRYLSPPISMNQCVVSDMTFTALCLPHLYMRAYVTAIT
jgi:hypothetical protein